ncbi:hypothetical protein PIB30_013698 [Stylosanthes scabra]|uniref:EF-hand domain-containing protein n=1 Tax=Stylosanthes scabra TaxID=79078 RepID=A0ABU6W6H3_9FABA|nr:hypothetical protein [Stylosanthes scabra]
MGSVCSSGMADKKKKKKNVEVANEEKATIRCAWKLQKKKKSFANRNEYSPYSNSRTIKGVTTQKNKEPPFSSDFKTLNPHASGPKQGSQRGSLLGRAGEKAVEVLDTLGSSIPKLSTSDGFISGMNLINRGHKICILAFEVANTINKGAILFQSLSEENIQFLKKDIFQSEGVKQLVSTDTKDLLTLVQADKREEFNGFSKEVVRFGNMCKEHQWHNLDRYFSRLDVNKDLKLDAEKTMQELVTLANNTAELYHELNAYDRFEQDYQQKVKEMESLNLPLKGESLTVFQSELKHQRKIVKNLQRKSLWSRNLEEIVEKLVDIVTYMHQSISKLLGNYGNTVVNFTSGSERLGEAGLALHYANIINQINMIASRPATLPPNMRDTLYHGLPKTIKSALQSRLQNMVITKEFSMSEVKAEMEKTLQWLTPLATNTTKAHQGFGWVGEWANGGNNEFGENTGKERNLIRLQTLYYAEKHKIDCCIIELLTCLSHLVTFVRYRHSSGNGIIKAKQGKKSNSSPQKGLDFQSKMLQFITSLESDKNNIGTHQISQEDKSLLEEVLARTRIPGVSKSENLALSNKKELVNSGFLHYSKSVGSSPASNGLFGFHHQNSRVLDLIDGLGH